MDRFSGLAKMREVLRLTLQERVDGIEDATRRLHKAASKSKSRSSFCRPVSDGEGGTLYVPCEEETIRFHVRFFDWLRMLTFRDPDQEMLPGLEEEAGKRYSDKEIDQLIVAKLAETGITVRRLNDALKVLDVGDIESIVAELRKAGPLTISGKFLRKCIRMMGEFGFTIRANRKKTYHSVS